MCPPGKPSEAKPLPFLFKPSTYRTSCLTKVPEEQVCPDCNGTKEYRGLNVVEPCRTCCVR